MKVLIISNNAFSKTQCNGKTLSSFFSNMGADNVAQLYFGNNENPDLSICNRYYRVTETQVLKSLLNLSFKTSNSHRSLMQARTANTYKESSIMRWLKRHSGTLSLFREFIWGFNTWDTIELDSWIHEFNPDLIFTLLGNNVYVHKIVLKLSEKYNLPIVSYFTDDYVINSTATNWIERRHYKMICKQHDITLSKVSLAYVIGDKMKQDYSLKYNRDFGILGNCIDFARFAHLIPRKIDVSQPIIISFIGGLHSNRWKSVTELGHVLKVVGKERNLDFRLRVFTVANLTNEVKRAFDEAGVLYCGSLTNEEVIKEIENSHFLLHVESFDEKYRKYVKYSISTKISECLVSNRMIIAFGPHEVASISLINENNFGCCITDLDSAETMKKKIIDAVDAYNSYDYARQYQYAQMYYNKESVSSILKGDMELLIGKE